MKKSIYMLAAFSVFVASTILFGCQSSDEKVASAQEKVQDAKQDLKEAQNDANVEANKAATDQEWETFKSESEAKIREDETQIAVLKEKMKSSGKTLDAVYAKKIETLEQKINTLKGKINTYDKNRSDWEAFKREFSHDMDELGQALKDLTVNNKK